MRQPRRPADPPPFAEDEADQTVFRRPNTLMPLSDGVEAFVHVLVPQPTGSAPPVRLRPGTLTIGRTEGADLILPGSEVSRRHCQIDLIGVEVIAGGEVVLTDLNSTNGTYVDGTRVTGTVALAPGARLAIGGNELLYERRSKRELDEAEALERDLQRTNQYVLAVLPLPIRDGWVRAEWYFAPCSSLGGDTFGYRDLGDGTFAGFMVDIAGDGPNAALQAVSVANLLRQDGLLGADFRDPASVMTRLNDSFPVGTPGAPHFTAWYWVYTRANRMLTYCAAGSHPAWLLDRATGNLVPLRSENPAIGRGAARYSAGKAFVPIDSALYMFSDGAFAIEGKDGKRWAIYDVVGVIRDPPVQGMTEPERIYTGIRAAARSGPLPDDVSIVVIGFP